MLILRKISPTEFRLHNKLIFINFTVFNWFENFRFNILLQKLVQWFFYKYGLFFLIYRFVAYSRIKFILQLYFYRTYKFYRATRKLARQYRWGYLATPAILNAQIKSQPKLICDYKVYTYTKSSYHYKKLSLKSEFNLKLWKTKKIIINLNYIQLQLKKQYKKLLQVQKIYYYIKLKILFKIWKYSYPPKVYIKFQNIINKFYQSKPLWLSNLIKISKQYWNVKNQLKRLKLQFKYFFLIKQFNRKQTSFKFKIWNQHKKKYLFRFVINKWLKTKWQKRQLLSLVVLKQNYHNVCTQKGGFKHKRYNKLHNKKNIKKITQPYKKFSFQTRSKYKRFFHIFKFKKLCGIVALKKKNRSLKSDVNEINQILIYVWPYQIGLKKINHRYIPILRYFKLKLNKLNKKSFLFTKRFLYKKRLVNKKILKNLKKSSKRYSQNLKKSSKRYLKNLKKISERHSKNLKKISKKKNHIIQLKIWYELPAVKIITKYIQQKLIIWRNAYLIFKKLSFFNYKKLYRSYPKLSFIFFFNSMLISLFKIRGYILYKSLFKLIISNKIFRQEHRLILRESRYLNKFKWSFDHLFFINYGLTISHPNFILVILLKQIQISIRHITLIWYFVNVIRWFYYIKRLLKAIKIVVHGVYDRHGRTRVWVWKIGHIGYSQPLNQVYYDYLEFTTFYGVVNFKLWLLY